MSDNLSPKSCFLEQGGTGTEIRILMVKDNIIKLLNRGQASYVGQNDLEIDH